MISDPAVSMQGVSKQYRLGRQHAGSLRERLVRIFEKKNEPESRFYALRDIDIRIEKGESVGIIGRNGAGKSTMLKLLSQITHPTAGRIEIEGRVASLLEVGTGFHPELTGMENIYLNGTILGMTRREIKNRLDEIIAFSGVEKFIDTPVKHFSSGMYVRLAFAVAAHLEPEILVIDEVLAVGDAEFQKKCLGKMDDAAHSGKTVIFVSHNMAAVRSLCQRGILLDKGQVKFHGPIEETVQQYEHLHVVNQTDFDLTGNRKRGAQIISFESAKLNLKAYYPNSPFEIKIRLRNNQDTIDIHHIQMAIFIADGMQNILYHLSTEFSEEKVPFFSDRTYSFKLDQLNLSTGTYHIWIWLQGNGYEQDFVDSAISFEVLEGNIYAANSPKIISLVQKEFKFVIN